MSNDLNLNELYPPPPLPTGEDKDLPTAQQISDMKKELKRLSNRRALAIAARLSGPSQDRALADLNSKLNALESDLSRVKQMKQKSASMASSKLIDGGSSLPIESLLTKLDALKVDVKDKVRLYRQQVRDEEDSNREHGVDAEEQLKAALSAANQDNAIGRERKKIEE